ncbi:MAG: HEAT repeat domain-containing protein [Planctomycetes bacterium]|nr:HEAT repeat domain-containing protein [Planctomycetota bacterium]
MPFAIHAGLLIFSIFASQTASAPAGGALVDALEQLRSGKGTIGGLVTFGEAAIPGIVKIMDDRSLPVTVRFTAANVLGEIGEDAVVAPLLRALADDEFNVRRCAAFALGKVGDPRARKPLEELAAKDPYIYKNPLLRKDEYLVRDAAKEALASLARGESFMDDAAKPPAAPAVAFHHLPWPFPGDFRKQNLFNNYQQPTDAYVHAGLDLLHPAGAEVRAVASGTVALIATNYPEWKTHHFFVITPEGKTGEGWCYTHVDPDQYTFKVGDKIAQGQLLGKLVHFTVGGNPGVDHLHLDYVKYFKTADNTYDLEHLFDPLQCFDYEDTIVPRIEPAVYFVKKGTLQKFAAGDDGIVRVHGKIDIIAGISDAAFSGQSCNWGVPVVTFEIKGERSKPYRKLVVDYRGRIGEERAAPALFVKFDDLKNFAPGTGPGMVHYYILTHTDGDGLLQSTDARRCWNTLATDESGARRFPDGIYTITIRAWDLKNNKSELAAKVLINNDKR